MKVEVRVYPRPACSTRRARRSPRRSTRLGHSAVQDVRAGKVFFIDVAGTDATAVGGRRAQDGRGAPREHRHRGLRREGRGVVGRRMKFAIVVFPGSNCDEDCYHIAKDLLGCEAEYVWHHETDLKGADAVILPGGFAYGDYLRAGALARFSPVMDSVAEFAKDGGPVLGICNGFQVLLEAGLLPGAMRVNRGLRYVCRDVLCRVENVETPFTRALRAGARSSRCRSGTWRATTRRRPRSSTRSRARGPGRLPLLRRRGPGHRRREPQRRRGRDRGHLQRGRKRRRPDAAPGPLRRGPARQRRGAQDVRVGRLAPVWARPLDRTPA